MVDKMLVWLDETSFDIKAKIGNWIIRKLLKHIHLYAVTAYDVLWKLNTEEAKLYVKQIEKARKESGCHFQDDYYNWEKNHKTP